MTSKLIHELELTSAGSVLKKSCSPCNQETLLEGRKILRGVFQVFVLWKEQSSSVCVQVFI